MNADTGQLAAIRDDVSELDGRVSELTATMTEILRLVVPLLQVSADRERQHADRSDHVRHSGRHRRDRLPPGCGGW